MAKHKEHRVTFSPLRTELTKEENNRIRDEISRTFLDQIYLEKEVEKLKLELAR